MDLALPTTLAIRGNLIPRIRATLASGRDDDELVTDTVDDELRPYSLAPLGGTPFSLDATLETAPCVACSTLSPPASRRSRRAFALMPRPSS